MGIEDKEGALPALHKGAQVAALRLTLA